MRKRDISFWFLYVMICDIIVDINYIINRSYTHWLNVKEEDELLERDWIRDKACSKRSFKLIFC